MEGLGIYDRVDALVTRICERQEIGESTRCDGIEFFQRWGFGRSSGMKEDGVSSAQSAGPVSLRRDGAGRMDESAGRMALGCAAGIVGWR